jgi:hypothetical protein
MCYCIRHRRHPGFSVPCAGFEARFSGFGGRLPPRLGLFDPFQAHSCPRHHQIMTRHPQIGQRKQRGNLRRIFLKTPVAGFHVAELALDDPKGMFDLGPNARLELLGFVQQLTELTCVLEGFALAWVHGYMPGHIGISPGTFFNALVAGICPDDFLLSVQQSMRLGDVMRVTAGAAHRVHQAETSIDANMRLHSKVPLVTLLAGMHLGVTGLVLVFGRTRCGNQGGIDGATFLEHQTAFSQDGIDLSEDLGGQSVLLQAMAESQDGALIRQANVIAQAHKLAVQRGVEEGFFHARVRQVEPLLQEVRTQHRQQRKRRSTGASFRVMRCNEVHQPRPRNDTIHFVKKDRFAGLAVAQKKTERGLIGAEFNAMYFKAIRPYSAKDGTCFL